MKLIFHNSVSIAMKIDKSLGNRKLHEYYNYTEQINLFPNG